jgi:hypothetical protein
MATTKKTTNPMKLAVRRNYQLVGATWMTIHWGPFQPTWTIQAGDTDQECSRRHSGHTRRDECRGGRLVQCGHGVLQSGR